MHQQLPSMFVFSKNNIYSKMTAFQGLLKNEPGRKFQFIALVHANISQIKQTTVLCRALSCICVKSYTVKKIYDFLFPSRDVTYQTTERSLYSIASVSKAMAPRKKRFFAA
jgi:hypothetical protein